MPIKKPTAKKPTAKKPTGKKRAAKKSAAKKPPKAFRDWLGQYVDSDVAAIGVANILGEELLAAMLDRGVYFVNVRQEAIASFALALAPNPEDDWVSDIAAILARAKKAR